MEEYVTSRPAFAPSTGTFPRFSFSVPAFGNKCVQKQPLDLSDAWKQGLNATNAGKSHVLIAGTAKLCLNHSCEEAEPYGSTEHFQMSIVISDMGLYKRSTSLYFLF
jgi:hypothetical protein